MGHHQRLESPFLVEREDLLAVEQDRLLIPLAFSGLQAGDHLEVEERVFTSTCVNVKSEEFSELKPKTSSAH